MKYIILLTTTILLACGLIISVAMFARHEVEERDAVKDLAVQQSVWNATRGIELTFTEPVQAVSWMMNGRTETINLNSPAYSVWLRTPLPQGQKSSIEILNVETTYKQDVAETWALSDDLPGPLTVTTNPGFWQLNVPTTGPYSVHFSAPIANRVETTRDISFSPPISGRWVWANSSTVDFYPLQSLTSATQETMSITDGRNGPQSDSGQYLSSNTIRPFITASDEEIVVREKLPESLTLYKNGTDIFHSLCNTAMTGAYTPTGTFYIRTKYSNVDMKGVNPDGKHYNDPHVHWVMGLIGNIAIHGYPRTSYGFPQSNGCVELPISKALQLYNLVQVGTPVEIVKP